jgi:DNA-directed RNA polymerase specialized sigma24 family protein
METRTSIEAEALLGQVSWVRALARRLIRDPEIAEDVAQDALLVALDRNRGRRCLTPDHGIA